jgi:hypothetical protein
MEFPLTTSVLCPKVHLQVLQAPPAPLEIMSKMFNGIKVWSLCRPLEDCKVFKPFLDLLAGVFEVIVL